MADLGTSETGEQRRMFRRFTACFNNVLEVVETHAQHFVWIGYDRQPFDVFSVQPRRGGELGEICQAVIGR
ncbi:hypothetical protein D3C73_1558610 [compost metagenome]